MTRGRSVAIRFIVISSRGLLHLEHIAHRDPLVYYRILALYPKSSGATIGCAAKRRSSHKKHKTIEGVGAVEFINQFVLFCAFFRPKKQSGDAVKHRPTG